MPASAAPINGPTTGIPAYSQSDFPLPEIGRTAWAIRGQRSRAGLMAYPVVPPSERPIAQTRHPTRYGPSPAAGPSFATAFAKIAPTMNTRTKVPMISLMRLAATLRIAGAVQKTASFNEASGVSFNAANNAAKLELRPQKRPTVGP